MRFRVTMFLVGVVAAGCGADKGGPGGRDAGAPPDAGADAAVELDAAGLPDAGEDAGRDAGADAGTDGGVPEACAGIVPSPGTEVTARLVTDGLCTPIYMTAPAGDPRLFVVCQGGQIEIVRDGAIVEPLFMDLSGTVKASGSERGLLGMAFHPDYADNGVFYVYYTAVGENRLAEARVSEDPDVADPLSLVTLLPMPDVYNAHNGGMLAFGPRDGYLYVATGDDATQQNAPDETSLLGKILRIEVDAAGGYAIPADNPFGNEVFVKGLRNPWRFSFDSATGDLYIGDVGSASFEEIDWLPDGTAGGVDLGWPECEGFACAGEGHTLPVYAYAHGASNAVIGGYVYRGAALPDVQGTYFFADAYTQQVFAFDAGTQADNVREVDVELVTFLSSFGEDGCGELYLVDYAYASLYQIVAQ